MLLYPCPVSTYHLKFHLNEKCWQKSLKCNGNSRENVTEQLLLHFLILFTVILCIFNYSTRLFSMELLIFIFLLLSENSFISGLKLLAQTLSLSPQFSNYAYTFQPSFLPSPCLHLFCFAGSFFVGWVEICMIMNFQIDHLCTKSVQQNLVIWCNLLCAG